MRFTHYFIKPNQKSFQLPEENDMARYYFENTPHGTCKNGKKLNTKIHYDYICREEKYQHIKNREEDLVFSISANMPTWADSPSKFWEEAEANRSIDGRAYREFRIGLQEELSLEENIELIQQLIKETGIKDNHAYSYAIHDKTATFDKNHKNIHCHLMFNEKIIEHDRPLPAEKYFNNYATNKSGEPTQGYRSSRYFAHQETTLYLRKRWAEIVNAKFKEKGLTCQISEKSLPNQRKELLTEGKFKEAELLNRIPAPHLGTAYRNPYAMERIMEHIEQVDQESENTMETTENINLTELPKKEQNIIIFAQDAVIRKVAREIQQERLRLIKEQEKTATLYKAAEFEEEPFIITIEDVYQYVDQQATQYQQKATDKLTTYKTMKSTILSDEKLLLLAQEKAFNGQYGKFRREDAKIARELKVMNSKASTLYGMSDKTHELAKCVRTINELTNKRNALGKQLNYYKTAINNSHKENIAEILYTLQEENIRKNTACKNLYAEYNLAKKQAALYSAALDKVKDEKMDTILFADKLPPQLTRRCKIDGINPVAKMPVIVLNKETYAILSPLPNDGKEGIISAVKLGDNITRGKAPIYKLSLQNDLGKWKATSVQRDENNTAYLYQHGYQENRTGHTQSKIKQQPPILQNTQNRRIEAVAAKISSIAEKFINDAAKNANWNAHWNDEKEVKDKAKMSEEKMYADWSL